jgi:hypothetical protein
MNPLAYLARLAKLLRSPSPARTQEVAREPAVPARIVELPRHAECPRAPESAESP